MPLLANGSGDANHRGARLKSPLPAETASFRLPDRTVCLCRRCREYGLSDSNSHNHELTGADAPRSMGLHGQATLADNFPPSVPQCRWRTSSTAPHGDVADSNFEITHPHHPLRGQKFRLVTYRHNWGEDRVYFHNAEGRLSSIPG